MRILVSLVALAVLALGPLACAATTDATDPSTGAASGEDEELKAAKVITEADSGKTIEVATGQSFSIQLQDKSASSGYQWMVKSVDKSLGQPKANYVPPSDPQHNIGANGTAKFTWSTKSPLDLDGKHTIELILQRPWAETSPPAKTFSVTVDIGGAAKCGDHPACGSGNWCSACWGKLACIPKGAMC